MIGFLKKLDHGDIGIYGRARILKYMPYVDEKKIMH